MVVGVLEKNHCQQSLSLFPLCLVVLPEKRLPSLAYAGWALRASLIPHREHRWK